MEARTVSMSDALPTRSSVGVQARERQWFFGERDRPAGPVAEGLLRKMLARHELGATTRVWADGMRCWVTADQVRELCPEVSTARAAAEYGAWSTSIRPSRRVFARLFDAGVVVICGATAGLLFGSGEHLGLLVSTLVGALVGLAVGVLLESLLVSRFGTTPGKALLSLRLRTTRGTPPSLPAALERSGLVWLGGLAAGILPLTLVTAFRARSVLCRTGATPWDAATGVVVEERPINAVWVVVATVIALAIMIVFALLLRRPPVA